MRSIAPTTFNDQVSNESFGGIPTILSKTKDHRTSIKLAETSPAKYQTLNGLQVRTQISEKMPKIKRNERYATEIASPMGLGQFDRDNPYDLTQLRIGKSNIISPIKSNSPVKIQHESSVTSPPI